MTQETGVATSILQIARSILALCVLWRSRISQQRENVCSKSLVRSLQSFIILSELSYILQTAEQFLLFFRLSWCETKCPKKVLSYFVSVRVCVCVVHPLEFEQFH